LTEPVSAADTATDEAAGEVVAVGSLFTVRPSSRRSESSVDMGRRDGLVVGRVEFGVLDMVGSADDIVITQGAAGASWPARRTAVADAMPVSASPRAEPRFIAVPAS
jgi:hypothetical protein